MERYSRSIVGLSFGLMVLLSGCVGIPEGTQKNAHIGQLQLQVKGAGLVKADTEKTSFRVKCKGCGSETGDIVIDTPSVGIPYMMNFVCPKCLHQQRIIIDASGL